MKFNELKLEAHTKSNRVGRGISAGQGKTAGRGTKGQKSRTGKKIKVGFEGGQTKLSRRLPKVRGFRYAGIEYQIVDVEKRATIKAGEVNNKVLAKAGLIKNAQRPVKLLGNFSVSSSLNVTAQAATKSAVASIEKAGGSVTIAPLAVVKKPVSKTEAN
ncbi:MAG: 50S ribosomal protein L15 [bacterium]